MRASSSAGTTVIWCPIPIQRPLWLEGRISAIKMLCVMGECGQVWEREGRNETSGGREGGVLVHQLCAGRGRKCGRMECGSTSCRGLHMFPPTFVLRRQDGEMKGMCVCVCVLCMLKRGRERNGRGSCGGCACTESLTGQEPR